MILAIKWVTTQINVVALYRINGNFVDRNIKKCKIISVIFEGKLGYTVFESKYPTTNSLAYLMEYL